MNSEAGNLKLTLPLSANWVVRKGLRSKPVFTRFYGFPGFTLVEKTPILRVPQASDSHNDLFRLGNQLIVFEF